MKEIIKEVKNNEEYYNSDIIINMLYAVYFLGRAIYIVNNIIKKKGD